MTAEIDYKALLVSSATTIRKAVEIMTAVGTDIVLVVDHKRRLKGIVVDSDVRKAILRAVPLESPVSKIMNPKPVTLSSTVSREQIVRSFEERPRTNLPLVDQAGRVAGLAQMGRYLAHRDEKPNWVVLLVGGLGRRLHPLTENQPKPLLPVGDKPILETIVEQFTAAGFRNFVFAVNHQADQIRRRFGDGGRLNANIRYVHETKPLGTAGPLTLLPGAYKEPLLVMNGDLLTKIDFKSLLDFHNQERSLATVCVREYDFQVPYGVIQLDGHKLVKIVEKPTHRFYVNAGIYVLDPKVLKMIPRGKAYQMPELLETVRRKKRGSVGCFPMREYWIDIGQMKDYERAQTEYSKFF